MTAQTADRSPHPSLQSSSVRLAACRTSRPPDQGCPVGAPRGAALTAIRPPAAAAALPLNGRRTAMCLATLATCALLAAAPPPATAQALDLERGAYVATGFSCDTAPSLASMDFDGRAFTSGRSVCRLETAGRQGDSYNVTCTEGRNTSARETLRWEFKLVSRRSFSVNGTTFRMCGAP
jgi:hypothetical protein